MAFKVRFSKPAERDVAELLDYLVAHAGKAVARAYVDRIIDYCAGFETFPERGTRRPESPGLRTVGYRRHATIAFEVKDGTVTIVRIFHGGRQVSVSDNPTKIG